MSTLQEAVTAATATLPRLYDINSAPANPEYPYGTQWSTLGAGTTYLVNAHEGSRRARIVLTAVGRTEASVLDLTEKWRALLVGQFLKVDGYQAAIVTTELDPALNRDADLNGLITATTTLTLTATKEQP